MLAKPWTFAVLEKSDRLARETISNFEEVSPAWRA